MSDIHFFDAHTRTGPRRHKHPAHPWKLSHLMEELDHCSISGALVTSTQSIHYDPLFGNRALSSELERHEHLFACWNVMPSVFGEFPGPEELARLMSDHDARAATISPTTNGWEPEADSSRELFEWLEDQAIPVWLDWLEMQDFGKLDRLLSRFPRLPLVLTGAVWSHQRLLLPLLQKHRQLHITFDKFQINEGPEDLCGFGLEDQLLFGSNAPTMSAGAHRCYIDYAKISGSQKAKIAGKNLARLLKGLELPGERVNREEDSIMAEARSGKPLSVPLIDLHMHILHEGLHGGGGSYRMSRGGPSGVFGLLDRLGCQGGGFMSWNGVVGADSAAGNRCTTAALDAAPGGYWGLATFDPSHYSQEELARMIPAVYSDRRFIGMKPYHVYGVEYHDPAYDLWWRYGNERNFYALIHRTRSDFLEVEKLAEKFPNVRWVVAHVGGSYEWADMAIEAMAKFPNIYAELTFTPVPLGIVDYLAERAGAERIVYGSDLPMRDPRQQLGWVLFSRLSEEAKRKILGGNAFQILAPCWEHLPEYNRPMEHSASRT